MKLKINPATVLLAVILASTSFSACTIIGKNGDDQPVARVFDNYLYRSDLGDVIPEGSSNNDSIVIARNYIDTWVRNQLMLSKAEEALSDDQKDVEKKIEEYRSSLLIMVP